MERIKRLGAIVSGNPYYTTALADNYSKSGLGPERADNLVRMGDVERAGISYSYHSDMPMAPAQPLFLMHCGVNRTTMSGRIAAPEQRVSREGALQAVTLNAAYSLRLEKEVGSIEPGKLANFTVLDDNPVTCDAAHIKDIQVWGTVQEGRVLPVLRHEAQSRREPTPRERELMEVRRLNALYEQGIRQRRNAGWTAQMTLSADDPSSGTRQLGSCGSGCSCSILQSLFANWMADATLSP